MSKCVWRHFILKHILFGANNIKDLITKDGSNSCALLNIFYFDFAL